MEPRMLVLMALASAAIAVPITVPESTSCATECSPSTKLNYAPGTTYMYDYRVDTITSMSGASEDSAKLTLTATAMLEVLSPCEMALSLRDTRLFHSDSTGRMVAPASQDNFRRYLERSPLRFSFQNGAIEHICGSGQREEPWALNIKKGALSAFQNSMEDLSQAQNLTETDVAGTCETEYTVTSTGYYSNSVRKVKDILTCTDRHDYRTMLQMVPYNVPSEIQNLPLMKTTHECDQEIEKGGVIKSSICKESHIYRPFSNGQSGGATTVTQTLTYKTYRQSVASSNFQPFTRQESLVFEHSAVQPSREQARHQTEQKLKEICESTAYDVRPESPRLFSELVSALKVLDKQTIEQILLKLKTKTLCPSNEKAYKTFLDALPMTGTSASVSILTSLIMDKDIKGMQAKLSIASLAFIKNPAPEMLLVVKQLVDSEEHREDSLLPVSSMVNNFCSKSDACEQNLAVLGIMASMERNIGPSCDASGNRHDQILLTLRAIGNAGHTTRAVPLINKCMTLNSNPLEIRVAAAAAFRRMPCLAESTDLWNIYENADLDSELRIAAYLALVRCPSDVTLAKMAASLEGEMDAHVGAFVYSHLTNLRETSDPHKQGMARALDNLVIPSKFESNPMKASTNLEASALINKINTGFVAEGNIIWSNKVGMPRSASANLTVELFGHSINLVEFGGRIENLEYALKKTFGASFGTVEGDEAQDISGSVYGRFFGNELLFLNSRKLEIPEEKSFSKKWLDMILTLAEGKDLEFTHSVQFLDVRMTIPSIAGLPIYIDINGSAVLDLVLGGKIDLRHLASPPRSVDIHGEIRPSAALEITGTMSVDAFATKAGLRMRNSLHTSTSLKGLAQLRRGKVLSVELDTPRQKMELFDASSKFFILHNNEEKEQQMITENRKEYEMCTSDKLADITGVVVCGQVSFPNASQQVEGPYFPLTGPSKASFVLRKVDTHSGYKLLAKVVENTRSKMAQISFNTPGSSVNRLILIDLALDTAEKQIEAQLNTPWIATAFNGAVVDKPNLKSLTGSLTVDETSVYALTSEVKVSKSKKKLHLSPKIEIRKPGMDNIQLSGYVTVEALKSLDVDLSLSGLQRQPYQIKTSVVNKKKEHSLTASFSKDGGNSHYKLEATNTLAIMGKKTTIISMSNSLKVNTPRKELVSIETKADFKEDKSLKLSGTVDIAKLMKKPAIVKVSIAKNAKKRGTSYDIDANIKSSLINSRLDSTVAVKNSGFLSTKTALDYSIPKVAKNKIILSGKFNDRSTKAYTKYTAKGNLDVKKNPEYNLGVTFDLDHKKKHSEAALEIKYGPNPKDKTKRLYLNTVLNRKIPNYKNAAVNYKIKAQAPEHNVALFLSGDHEHNPKTIDSTIQLTYGKKQNVKASVFLKNKSDRTAKINGRASLEWPGSEYLLISKLDQKSAKAFTHDIVLKENNKLKHSMETTFKMPSADSRVIKTELNLEGVKKITLSGSSDLAGRTPYASAEIQYGKDRYGLSTKAKKSKAQGGTLIMELIHPERRVLVKLNGEKARNKADGSIEASWDADKDKSKKITLGGTVYNKKSWSSVSLGGDVSFTSPFDKYENLAGTFKYGSDNAQHDVTGKFSWGGKHKQVMTSLSLEKPISLNKIVGTIEVKTPLKKMRAISGEISHTWDNALKTILKGKLNKENAKLILSGEGDLNNLKASMSLSSTIKNAEDISGSLNHNYDTGKLENSAQLTHNGKPYAYSLNMDHSRYGWNIKNKGDLILTLPQTKISNAWDHMSEENNVKSTFSSQWGNKKVNVDLSGSHELSAMKTINGDLKIETPWKSMRDVGVSLDHKHGNGAVKSKASLVHNGKTKAVSDIKFSQTVGSTDMDITLKSPLHQDLSGEVKAKYDAYPMTSSVEGQWGNKKVTAETSVNAENWDNAAFDLKVATPFRGYRNVNLKAANRKEGDAMVSQINLDYGVRKSIDLEARNKLNGRNKLARVRLTTPFENVKSLDAGLMFDGEATSFDSSADFEMVPMVGKFQGSAKWMYNGDLSSSLRLDTPYPDYPYFELSASSQESGRARKSRVEARLHPQQVYSFDSLYAFDLPISVEATVNSPYPEYDNLGLVFQHNHSPSSVASHAELRYQADKKIEADLNGDWASNLEGNLMVKTPFSGYESNKIALRHQGDLDQFTSHGEIHVAEKSVVADASFKSGYNTAGTFSLRTPTSALRIIDLTIKKKGRATKNVKGDVTLKINDEKIDIDYSHKIAKDLLRSNFKLTSSKTQPLKLSFEHKGTASQFTNEISANYGRKYDVDTTVNFNYNHPDVNGHGTIKYKLGGRRNTARASFNKNGALSDMSFRGTTALNDDEVSVSGSWKNTDGLNGNVQLNTPFVGFKTTGLTVSHDGSLNDFRSSLDLTYMDEKNINGKISLSNNGLKHINLDSEFTTPFEKLPSATLTLNHDYDNRNNIVNGDIALTTPIAEFGSGSINYNKVGGIENLVASTQAKRNGRQAAAFKLTNTMRDQEIHSNLNVEAAEYPDLTLSFDHMGDLSNFNTKASANLGSDNINGEISKRGPIDDLTVSGSAGYNGEAVQVSGAWNSRRGLDGNLEVQTPFENFHDIGLSLSHSGVASDFSSTASVRYMDDKTVSGKLDLTVGDSSRLFSELNTPFPGFESTKIEATGSLDDDVNAKVTLTTTVNDFGNGEATFSKTGSLDNLVVDGNILRNNIELANVRMTHRQSASEINSGLNIRGSLVPEIATSLSHTGGLEDFETQASASVNADNKVEGKLTVGARDTSAKLSLTTLFNDFGSGEASFSKSGNLENLAMDGSIVRNNREMGNFRFTNDGDLSNFNTKASANLGSDNINAEISKRGPIDDLTVSGSAGYNGKAVEVSGAWNNRRGLDGNLEIKTPFRGFENTKLEASGSFDDDVNAKVTLTTTVNDFGNGEATFSKTGSLDNLVVDGNILRNNRELGSLRITNTQGYNSLQCTFNCKYSDLPEVMFTLDHNGDRRSFNTKARASVGNRNEVEGETSFSQRGNKMDADLTFLYNIEKLGSNQGSVVVSKDGRSDDFNVRVTGKLNGQESTVTGEMKLNDQVTGALTINTPVDGYNNVGLSFKHAGSSNRFNSEAKMNIVDGEQYSAKIDFYRDQFHLIETSVAINTPIQNAESTKFEYRHEGQRDSIKCSASLEYGQSNKITYDMSAATEPNLDFSVSVMTPFDNYEDLMASATVDNTWPKLSITSKVKAGNGRQATLTGSLDASKDITGSLALSTPLEGFSNVGLSFEHSGKLKNFKSEGRVTYMDDKEISGKVVFKLRRSFFSAEVKTPFSGYEYTKCELRQIFKRSESTTTTYVVYGNGKVVSTETTITVKPRPGFSVNIKTPVPQYEELMASASFDSSWPKLELNSKASAGNDRQVTFDASFDATDDISGSIQIGTPVDGFKTIGLNFQHSGNSQKFDTEGKVTYMDGQDIKGKVTFYKYMWRRLVATAELSTPFSGAENTKAEINYEDNSNSISTTAAIEYNNGQKMDGTLKVTYSPSYDALLTINTPFDELSVIRAQGSLDVTAPSYSAGYSINYGDNKVYSANGKLNLYSVKNMDGSLEVVLPIQGIEFTKAEYQHKISRGIVDGSVTLTYADSQTISGELKASSVPTLGATITVRTPFEGFETVQGSASYGDGYDKYEASTSLKLGSAQPFSMTSSLDLSAEPYRASVQMDSPYRNYRNMELVLTHEGGLNNFHSTGFLSSPLTDNINADASLKFTSVSDMEASASLKSSLVGMDDLLAEVKNSDVSGEKKTHAVLGWTSGQQIVLDGQLRQQEGWYENKIFGDLSLSTPFETVRSLGLQMEHSGKQDESAQKLGLELNGDKLVDVDSELSSKTKHQATLTFRKPLAMKYMVAGSSEAGLTETEVLANWDMDKMDSSVHLLASVNDQSDSYKTDRNIDIGLEHASRKMGLVHKLSSSNALTSSSGKIYWDSDDSSKLSYDLEVKDSSRRNKEVKDGQLTFSLPSRTLKLAGSCSDNQVVKKADAMFSWDADRSDRQIGLKGTMTRGDRIKGDITLSMPAIRKEIRVDGELMSQNGRIILDAKTDISYSQDSRKTLTLTSKIEDISDYYSHYNYSLAVGVSHPYTNVDIQMTSILGSSDEKMTVGVSTDYLTARRQTKNLGLLAEINKLKKQISLKLTNPINKVEIIGDVVSQSPYKVRMLNKIDDVETFRSDLTVAEDKKSIELNMFEGSEGISLWAGYPNSTAFRSEVRRINYGSAMTEALLAVRLNTSRLMHTRLHWNPDLIQEIQGAVRERTLAGSIRAAEVIEEVNTAVSDELAGKYSDITGSISEELAPLVRELEKEMTQVARALTRMSRGMRAAYEENAFYVQDMGDGITEAYMMAQERLKSLTREYRETSAQIIRSLNEGLQQMTSYPVKERYSQLVSGSASWLNEKAQSTLSSLESCLAKMDAALTEYHDKISKIKIRAVANVYNGTYVNYLSDQLAGLSDFDVSPYVPSMEIPEQYSSAIYSAHDAINARLGHVLDAPGLRYIKGGVNELYQQGKWAYNYWQVEENIHAHVENILELIKEIIEEELKEYAKDLQGMYQNPITVWDPEHGEAQAEFRLPVDVARIDQVPDLSPLTDQVVAYLPDASTLEKVKENVSDFWESMQDEEEVTKQLRKYKPSKKIRKAKKGRKYRVRTARN